MKLAPVAVLILSLTVPSPAPAQNHGEPYGERYLIIDAGWAEEAGAAVPPPLPDDAAGAAALQQLLERAEEQELSAGPYGPGLAETLGDIARLQEAGGDWAAALATRRRALHLVRINEGLYSPAQGPLVRAMLDSYRRRGEFEALDEQYDYFFRLYGSARPPISETGWRATLEYLRWQREALRREVDEDFKRRLLRLFLLNEELLDDLREGVIAPSWPRWRELAGSQLLNLYLIQTSVRPPDDRREIWGETPRTQEIADLDMDLERLQNIRRRIRARGRDLMEELLELAPAGDPLERARVSLALADWNHWLGSTGEARSQYLQLYEELSAAGASEQIGAWFGRPVPLPDNGAFWQPDRPAYPPIVADLELPLRGRVEVAVRNEGLADSRAVSRLRRALRLTRFRPVIRDGEIVAASLRGTAFSVYE